MSLLLETCDKLVADNTVKICNVIDATLTKHIADFDKRATTYPDATIIAQGLSTAVTKFAQEVKATIQTTQTPVTSAHQEDMSDGKIIDTTLTKWLTDLEVRIAENPIGDTASDVARGLCNALSKFVDDIKDAMQKRHGTKREAAKEEEEPTEYALLATRRIWGIANKPGNSMDSVRLVDYRDGAFTLRYDSRVPEFNLTIEVPDALLQRFKRSRTSAEQPFESN